MNQHRWKSWVDAYVRGVLERGAEGLEWAWKLDRKHPKSYPANTWYTFVQIEEQLQKRQPKRANSTGIKRPPPPKTLAELVHDNIIRVAYEDQNAGSYREALKQARAGYGEGLRAFRKILRAVETAYLIELYNFDHTPAPKVHFLHRKMLDLANSEHVGDLNLEGIVEFFDDVCPCGEIHKSDAVRKLMKRWARHAKPHS